MFRENLQQIINRIDLDAEQMSEMILEIFSGNVTEAQIGAFMAALATKGETFTELAGAARAMREKAVKIIVDVKGPVMDTCGTGGDGKHTINISTITAFVIAGCGITVAKHGNRSVSSKCGSADLLEALGVNLSLEPGLTGRTISEVGIGFMFAPLYHGAMKYAGKARQEIGLRSIFNMLGPLTNPAGAQFQLLGVYAPALTEMFANALKLLGSKRAFIVHGNDGLDEISICDSTRITELDGDLIKTYEITPEQFFGYRADLSDIKGGDAAANAEITTKILEGEKGPRRDIILLNASAALVVAGKAGDIKAGIEIAGNAIDDGSALKKLNHLVEYTNSKV